MITSIVGPIVIAVAMDKELNFIKKELTDLSVLKISNHDVYLGSFLDKKIVLAKTGIGKVAASSFITLLIERYQPTLIINMGIAGGYSNVLKTLDTVIITAGVYSDVDMLLAGNKDIIYGQLEDQPPYFEVKPEIIDKLKVILKDEVKYGMIATGDQFVTDYAKCEKIVDKYPPSYDILAFDMESTAILQVCHDFRLPCIVIRTISDIIGSTSLLDYMTFSHLASTKAGTICKKILSNI